VFGLGRDIFSGCRNFFRICFKEIGVKVLYALLAFVFDWAWWDYWFVWHDVTSAPDVLRYSLLHCCMKEGGYKAVSLTCKWMKERNKVQIVIYFDIVLHRYGFARTNMLNCNPYKVSKSGSKLHDSNLWAFVTFDSELHDSNFLPLVPERIYSFVVLISCWCPVFSVPNCVTPTSGHAASCYIKAFPFIHIHRFKLMV